MDIKGDDRLRHPAPHTLKYFGYLPKKRDFAFSNRRYKRDTRGICVCPAERHNYDTADGQQNVSWNPKDTDESGWDVSSKVWQGSNYAYNVYLGVWNLSDERPHWTTDRWSQWGSKMFVDAHVIMVPKPSKFVFMGERQYIGTGWYSWFLMERDKGGGGNPGPRFCHGGTTTVYGDASGGEFPGGGNKAYETVPGTGIINNPGARTNMSFIDGHVETVRPNHQELNYDWMALVE